jgi:hypothetical protein
MVYCVERVNDPGGNSGDSDTASGWNRYNSAVRMAADF